MTTATTVLDQNPAPAPSQTANDEIFTQSIAVTGGTLYQVFASQGRNNGGTGHVTAISQTFVPNTAGQLTRYLPLSRFKSDAAVALTATPTGGAMGVSRSAGVSFYLKGESTSASSLTDKALYDMMLPDAYAAGANITVTISAQYAGAGTVTVSTLALAAYTEAAGVETAIAGAWGAAQTITNAAANYTFVIPGTGLVPGQTLTLEFTTVITTSAGAANSQVNSVAVAA